MGWSKTREQGGAEWADVTLGPGTLVARGVGVAARPVPYRMAYRLEAGPGYVTRRLRVDTAGEGWSRRLDLRRSEAGSWSATARATGRPPLLRGHPLPPPGAGADVLDALDGALDCDLGWCPLTNTMPVLRHGLLEPSQPHDFLMAFVEVPDLAVRPSFQRYSFVRRDGEGAIVRYESGSFTADIRFDEDGLVVDYPRLGRRL